MSIEIRVTRVAISNVLIWVLAWTPYAVVCLIGAFGNRNLVTPLVAQLPAFLAKLASAINPVIAIISHPAYREALFKTCSRGGSKVSDSETNKNTTIANVPA